MNEQAQGAIPAYLQELLEPTPSGMAKLIAAWDGLTPETQIALLTAMERHGGYFYRGALEKALSSPNAYVRYLAARDIRLDDRDPRARELQAQIDNDPEPLVRYARLEKDFGGPELEDAEKFFALPQEARLATVRRLALGGEAIAKLISYAVEHQLKNGVVSETELVEILSDYLSNPRFKSSYIDEPLFLGGSSEYGKGKDIEALWNLVPRVPKSVTYVLIEHIPESAGLCSGIPDDVLNRMSDWQLATLLYRSDVELETFRKEKFFETIRNREAVEENGEAVDFSQLRPAAISHVFDLTNEEFSEILSLPDKSRVRILRDLAYANDLRLCLYEAIHDALWIWDEDWDNLGAEMAEKAFESKLDRMKAWRNEGLRNKELLELKLYRLAREAVPWKNDEIGYPPTDELALLEEAIVKGDPWATFVAFTKKWTEIGYAANRNLEKHLPQIWEAGEEEDFVFDREEVDDAESLAEQVARKLTKFFTDAQYGSDSETSPLAEVLSKLGGYLAVAQERTLEAVNSLKTELTELRRIQGQQHIILWVVIAILVVLLMVSR
jgi:hypothetical protein